MDSALGAEEHLFQRSAFRFLEAIWFKIETQIGAPHIFRLRGFIGASGWDLLAVVRAARARGCPASACILRARNADCAIAIFDPAVGHDVVRDKFFAVCSTSHNLRVSSGFEGLLGQ